MEMELKELKIEKRERKGKREKKEEKWCEGVREGRGEKVQ